MFDRFHEIVVEDLPQRPVRRADLALGVAARPQRPHGSVTIVFDGDQGQFVRVPDPPPGIGSFKALSPDGAQVLLMGQLFDGLADGFCLQTLATGEQRWFSTYADGSDSHAALSPDGSTLATLGDNNCDPSLPDDFGNASLSVISLIDIATGERRRLWAGRGSMIQESHVSFSPDGQLVAASQSTNGLEDEDRDEGVWTVVVDLSGRVRCQLEDTYILPSSNGTWSTNRQLVCCREIWDEEGWDDMRLGVVDVDTGSWRDLAEWPSPFAWTAAGLVMQTRGQKGDPDGLSIATVDGTVTRPYVTIAGPYGITGVDLSSAALRML